MTAGTIVFWRHGRTAYNATTRLQGSIDIPLDDVGRWQVEQAAADLARRFAPSRVVASNLGRAIDTAARLAELVDVPVETDPRLRERAFGDWEGLSIEEIAERWPTEYAVWKRGEDPQRGGSETRAEVAARIAAAVTEHAETLDDEETLVVVSHGAAISLGITTLLGLDPAGWRGLVGLHNAHWSVLRARSGTAVPAWRLESHNLGPSVRAADWHAGVPSEALPSSTADALRQ